MVTNLYSIKIIKPVWLGDLTYSPIHTSIYIYIIAVLYYFYYFGTWSTRKSAHARLCGVLDIYPHEVPLPDAFFMHHHFQKRSRVTQFLLLSFFLVGSSQEKRKSETRRNEVWRRIWSHYELSLEGNSIEELRKNFPRRSPKCYYWFLFLGGFPVNLIVTTCLSSVVG